MLYCIGYMYVLDRNEVTNYAKLTPALEEIYGKDQVKWKISDRQLIISSDTKDLDGLRDKLRKLGVTPTWEEFVSRELD